jgi:deferrochelatase/peroxidase EfeB
MKIDKSARFPDRAAAMAPLYDDIQGLMINGYRGFNFIRFLIFTIPEANIPAVRKLCGALIPGTPGSPLTITPATRWQPEIARPAYRLNIGLTKGGLMKLITPASYKTVYNKSYQLMARFSRSDDPLSAANPYGAAYPATAQSVGDTGPSDPQNWWQTDGWQLPSQKPADTDLDLLLSLYAPTAQAREEWHERLMKMIGPDSAVLAFMQDSDPLDPAGQQIHFGYRDGISQPRIAGFSETNPELDDRPNVDSWRFIINLIAGESSSPPTYHAHPLLNNGSFAAFRFLSQDVKAFEDFINRKGADPELIASKLCGRWRDGTPVEVSPLKPENTHLLGESLKGEYDLNNFNYIEPTPHQLPKPAVLGNPDNGQACPFAAHIRRANPRDDNSVTGNSDMASQHRILRRARPYGPPYDPSDDESASQDRGLIGLFIGADLQNQFEFLMGTWIINGNFSTNDGSPNNSGYDPLFGPPPDAVSPHTTEFSFCTGDPSNPADYETLQGLPQLIVTKGGLYVFLPSITALGFLAKGAIPHTP